jgi:hypothetical protein
MFFTGIGVSCIINILKAFDSNTIADWLNPVVTLLAGVIALGVYYSQNAREKKNAAIILVMDIRYTEGIFNKIKLEEIKIDRRLTTIMVENNWAKYKHLFVQEFSQDDFEVFNAFFMRCSDISRARDKVVELFYHNLFAKAEIYQQKILDIVAPSPSSSGGIATVNLERRNIVHKAIYDETFTFGADEPEKHIEYIIKIIKMPSNTPSFEKLKKIAEMK